MLLFLRLKLDRSIFKVQPIRKEKSVKKRARKKPFVFLKNVNNPIFMF